MVNSLKAMKHQFDTVNPSVCPLCGEGNACMNLSDPQSVDTCWCQNPAIVFSDHLLKQVPSSHNNQACICKKCAETAKSELKG